jgi:predicted GIY-YIG superfamily endonuclease
MAQKTGYVYLMTNKLNTVIYTGVTSNLKKRIYEHREKLTKGFTKNIKSISWYIMKYLTMWKTPSTGRSKLRAALEERKRT